MAYVLFYLLNSLLSLGDIFKELRKYRAVAVMIMFVSIILFASLRWQVGYDWGTYYSYYLDVSQGDFYWFEGFNWGYSLLNYFFGIFNSYSLFLFATALIMLFFIYKFINYFSNNVLLSLFLYAAVYYLPLGLGQVRQGIAVSLLAYACIFIHKKIPFIFAVLVLFASSFHLSALVFLPLYFFYHRMQFNRLLIIIVSVLMIVIGQQDFVRVLYVDLYERVPIDNAIVRQFFAYTRRAEGGSLEHYLGFYERLVVLTAIVIYYRRLVQDSKTWLLTISYVVAANIYNLFFTIAIFAGRFGANFKFVDIALFPILINISGLKKNTKMILYILVFVYAFFRAFIIFSEESYANYKLFFLN